MTEFTHEAKRPLSLAVFLIIAGVIGWFASFDLLIEKIHTLTNPEYIPSCNISPLVSCGPNMASAQGSVFGFPNPIIGTAAFVAPIVVGVAVLAGAHCARWFWGLFNLGIALALAFVIWLISQSIFVLGTLCPYCIVVWAVVIPLFWYVTLFNLKEGNLPAPAILRQIARIFYPWAWLLTVLSYAIIVLLSQLRLDAVTSLLTTLS